jgi:antitoxin (DNA-binding transcriptional repressor) of toxin-antitoxin stability system
MALCRRADVIICRRGTPVAVLLGFARFQRLAEAAARADEHLRKGSADQD